MSLAARLGTAVLLVAASPVAGQEQPAPQQAQSHWLRDEQTGCRAPDPDFADGDGIVWSGACSNGVVNGQGTLTFLNKDQPQVTITGKFRDGNLESGHASLAWPDGSKYDGDQIGGKFEGRGVFVSAQQDRLDGEWKNGLLNGHAAVTWANGNRYEGAWANGKAEGRGVEVWANGDRYDGEWHDGKAQGRGVQMWANGQTYDGEWRDDQPNGVGKLVRADGTKFDGKFVDGHPASETRVAEVAAVAKAQVTAKAAPTSAPTAAALPGPKTQEPSPKSIPAAASIDNSAPPLPNDHLAAIEGKKLSAVDGSSIALAASDDGFTRTISRSDGGATTTVFSFVNDRMGTVADVSDPDKVTGMFKVTDTEIDVDYSDGHSEVLRPLDGGVTLAMRAPGGQNYCMAWYPDGHTFSEAERRAALAAYASRLGVPLKGADARALQHSNACSVPPSAPSTVHPQEAVTVKPALPHPAPKPIRASYEVAAPRARVPALQPQGPITVRTSQVHLIDAPAPESDSIEGGQSAATPLSQVQPSIAAAPATGPGQALASLAPAPMSLPGPQPNQVGASTCLSVASDGTHWGFKNSCNYAVQFAYCLKGGDEPLAGCKDGSITGSAPPASFSALVADASMHEKNIDHQFRWIACNGGAGEVVPKLDGVDPPVGRCLKARSASN